MADQFEIAWHDARREPKEQPNPDFPEGIDLDLSKGEAFSCVTDLPYPARRCGGYSIICRRCGYRAYVTTAGRADDPRSIRLACKGQHP